MRLQSLNRFTFKGWIFFLLLAVAPHFVYGAPIKDPNPVLRSGDLLPPMSCPNLLSPSERTYLGVGDKATFQLNHVQADLVVIKFLNTNCVYCIKLLPTFNLIFQAIQQDERLKARAKILAIGAGDTSSELDDFKKKYSIPYPVIPDTEFKAHKAVGEPRVPFIVVARKDKQGQWIVATVNIGLIFSAESFVGELKSILDVDPEGLKLKKTEAPTILREYAAVADVCKKTQSCQPDAEDLSRTEISVRSDSFFQQGLKSLSFRIHFDHPEYEEIWLDTYKSVQVLTSIS